MFEELLRSVCKDCTESTIRTYTYNVRALAKLADLSKVPLHSRWLNVELLKKIKQLPVNQFKKHVIAGAKALKAYGKTSKTWAQGVRDAEKRYQKHRSEQKRTPREQENWPDDGYDAMKTLAKQLREEVAYILRKAPATTSNVELYALMQWFVILFYSRHALRGDLAECAIKKRGQNYIYEQGNKWNIHIGQHKTVKHVGAIDFELDPAVQEGLKVYLPYVRAKTSHGYLLSTKVRADKLSRRDMLKMMRNLTEERLGKRIGVQLVRVLRTTASEKAINQAAKLRAELGHGARTQLQYISV